MKLLIAFLFLKDLTFLIDIYIGKLSKSYRKDIHFTLFIAYLGFSFNFNNNLVIAEISFTLQFSNHPPTHSKSNDNCDISAVTDQILMKI